MAFVNLPPSLQDIFYSITDRIAKLETGPSQAMYTAEYAQSVAESAQGGSLTAQTTAAAALAQSTIAQAQATSAQALAAVANTTASTASAQATTASAQAVTAQATANTALLAASVASAQAITANNTANAAASQATIAQSQATIASSQATAAQVSANGKNNNYYSTSAPTSSTPNVAGDIWYQYGTTGTYANKVIAQWSGAGGTGPSSYVWTPVTVSGLVIANIDAGSITTGTLSAIQISAGTGGTSFTVSPSGVMQAQGAYIVGNITAQSGTFNGQVNATSGYFGSPTNGWQINAGGIAGLGSGYVSGGTIQGTNFNNGNGTFFVNSTGAMVAQSVYAQGVIRATSGFFGTPSNGWQIDSAGITGIGSGYIAGGAIQGTSFNNGNGTFFVNSAGSLVAQNVYVKGAVLGTSGYFGNASNGWQIDSSGITGIGSGYIAGGAIQGTTVTGGIVQTSTGSSAVVLDGPNNALGIKFGGTFAGWLLGIGSGAFMMHYGTAPSVTGYPRTSVSSTTASLAADGSNSISVTTTGTNYQGNSTFGGATNTFTNTVVLNGQTNYPGAATASGSTLVLVGTGSRIGYVSSSRKTKKNIEPLDGTYMDKINALEPVSFDWLDQPEDMPYRRNYGFIAEDTYLIPEIESVVNLNENQEPITISYDRLAPFFAKALQEIDARLKAIEQNITNL